VDGSGFSIWVLLVLVALLFVVLWGSLVFLLAFATWFIARNKLPGDEERPRRGADDWDVPLPRDLHPPDR